MRPSDRSGTLLPASARPPFSHLVPPDNEGAAPRASSRRVPRRDPARFRRTPGSHEGLEQTGRGPRAELADHTACDRFPNKHAMGLGRPRNAESRASAGDGSGRAKRDGSFTVPPLKARSTGRPGPTRRCPCSLVPSIQPGEPRSLLRNVIETGPRGRTSPRRSGGERNIGRAHFLADARSSAWPAAKEGVDPSDIDNLRDEPTRSSMRLVTLRVDSSSSTRRMVRADSQPRGARTWATIASSVQSRHRHGGRR